MPTDPSARSGSALSEVERADRRSRLGASMLALLTAVSIWLSAGIILSGDLETRVAALPSLAFLGLLALALPAVAWFATLRLEHAWPLCISLVLWLPFLPFQVGASYLMWEGPIEGIVWLVVLAGLIVARPPVSPTVFSSPTMAPWIAGALVALSSLLVFSQVRNVIPGGDEPHYLAATQSLMRDADLKVANNYAQGEYLDYFPGRLEPHFLKRSASGEIYSIHAPGVSFIVLPAFAIAGYTGAVTMMIAFGALTAALIWRVAFAVTESSAAAWFGVAGVGFSAPFFFHTFTIYPEIVGAFCAIAAAWLLVELENGREVSERSLIAVGAGLAVLPWLHSRFAVIAGIAGLLISARLTARSSALHRIRLFLSIPTVAAVAWFSFFYLIWGSPSPAAPYGPDTSTSTAYVLRGLIGLMFDQQFGLLTTAPIYVMALVGGVALFRWQPRLAVELALIVVPYAIAVASYAMWWGGAAAPARFLVAILPLASLPLAAGYASSKSLRAVSIVLLVISVALLMPRAFEDEGRFIYNNRSGVDATVRWLSADVDLPSALPSVHRDGGTAALGAAAIWLVGFTLATMAIRKVDRRSSDGRRFAIAGLVVFLATALCASGAWAFIDDSPADSVADDLRLRRDRELATLARFRPAWQTTIRALPSGKALTTEAFLVQLATPVPGPATTLERVPAGEYVVLAAPSRAVTGSVAISVGRNAEPIAEPTLDDLRNAHSPFRLRLPVMARTLSLRVNAAGSAVDLVLRPVSPRPALIQRGAIRAARYGHTRAFFFDEWLYPERDGFWTRAHGSSSVVITTDEGTRLSGLPIAITGGAVPTSVTLSMGTWEESFALAPGRRQDVVLPPADGGSWLLRIRSGDGFRPSEREPGSRDVRELAAWIAIY